jgi:hypothetical protein
MTDEENDRPAWGKRDPLEVEAMTPLEILFDRVVAQDETGRCVSFASLRAAADDAQLKRDAYDHALECLDACGGWDEETLAHNIESNFPDLDPIRCGDIAYLALKGIR